MNLPSDNNAHRITRSTDKRKYVARCVCGWRARTTTSAARESKAYAHLCADTLTVRKLEPVADPVLTEIESRDPRYGIDLGQTEAER